MSKPADLMSYEAKPLVLDVIRDERAAFYALVEDPANWEVQTRCTDWQGRDIVGHMIDVTEGYLAGWEVARRGDSADGLGLVVMGERLNDRAQEFRALPREEVIARLKRASDELIGIFESLTEEQWGSFMVPHPYMGPLPPLFFPFFQVMDYGVHNWDIRYGLGDKLGVLDERTAGVLVPYMFVLFQYTVDQESAKGLDTVYGLEVSSQWGGRWRVTIHDGQFEAKPEEGSFEGCEAVISYDPSDFVLSAFQRYAGGCARGDADVIDRVRTLFFRI